jgi:ABC-2 type transport system ATP-binding protein
MSDLRIDDEKPLVEIRGLRKLYAGFSLDVGRLALFPGDVVGLVGPNGAGKTTLLRSLLGIIRADAGQVFYEGRHVPPGSTELRVRTGYVPEEPILYEAMTVAGLLDFSRHFYPTWDAPLSLALLDFFRIDPVRRVRALSKGMRNKLLLVAALSHHAEVLVLDEPTAGLDPPSREEFWRFVLESLHRQVRAVLISTHHLDDVEQVCNRVLFFNEGRIQADRREISIPELRELFRAARPQRPLPWS